MPRQLSLGHCAWCTSPSTNSLPPRLPCRLPPAACRLPPAACPPAARIIAARQGHKGALLPGHIRAAYAALEADRRTPHSRALRKPLR